MPHRIVATYTSLLNVAKPLGLIILTLFFITACDNTTDNGGRVNLKVPQSLIAKAGARSVTLNWAAVANAARYTVYWSNQPDLTRSDSAAIQTTQPLYAHDELINGSTYYYAVTSHTDGIESRLSAEVSALPEEAVPVKPASLDLKAEDTRITIRYETGIPGVIQYQLLWDTAVTTALSDSPRRFNLSTNPFVHDNLTNGQTYRYLLRVTNAAGKSTDSEVFQAKPQAALPLAPVITSVTASSGQAVLTWLDHSNADGFDLYWSNSPEVTTASAYVPQVNSPFSHAPLSNAAEQHYYYRLQARNGAGVSPLSNRAHVTTPDTSIIDPAGDLPAMPVSTNNSTDNSAVISLRADDGQLTLDWSVGTDPAAVAYNLYWRRGSADLDAALVLDRQQNDGVIRNIQPPYTHIGLQNNVYYYYRLSAVNHAGEGDLSARTYAERPERIEPGVPSGVAVLAADQRFSVRWNPVDRADGYILTVDGNATADVVSPFTLAGLVNGQTYTISLQSVTAARTSQPSQAVTASPRVARPSAPTRLLAIGSDSQVRLQWDGATAPESIDPSEAAISAYRVYRATQAGISPRNAELLPVTPTAGADDNRWQADVPDLNNGRRYYFIVTALNSGGEGPASNPVWSLPQVAIPSAPSRLSARPGDNQVTLRFESASDATGSPSYNLYWSKDSATGRSPTQVITNISQSPDYVFSDDNANGTTYYFRVSASNPGGESVLSAEVSATPQIPAPQAIPTNVAARASSSQVDLSWDSVANATSYVIFWSNGGEINAATSAQLTVNDGATTSLSQTSLRNGQRLFYRIAARNAGGLGPLSPTIDALPQIDPPATPNTFAVLAADAAITINWDPVATAVSYRLYWRLSTESTWSFVQGVQPGYVHRRLSNASSYDYYLLAQNPGGNSAPTTTLQATPQLAIPAKPLGLSIAAGDGQNSINWFSQVGLSYDLHWSTGTADPMASGQVLNNVLPITTHGRLTPLNNDQPYHYQVVAKNADGLASPPSDIVSATPRLATAGAPTGLSALGGEQQITLNWFAPANAPADTTYTLYWGTQASAVTNTIIDINLPPYVHTPLDSNQSYFYRITATVAGTESPPSNLARGTTKRLTPPPDNTVPYVSDMNISAFGAITIGKALTGAYRFNDDEGDEEGASILQWYRNGTALTGGTTSFYTLMAADAGQIIRFEVTPVAITGMSPGLAKWVEITIAPNNAAPVASAVSISGYTGNSTKVDDNLLGTYAYSDAENNDQGASLFQWRLDGRAITGATQQNYTVTTNDAGKKLTFEVTPVALAGASPGSLVVSLPLDVDAAAVITQNLVGMSSGILVGIDAATGNVTARSGLGLAGFKAVKQISYDHINKLIYGINELPMVGSGSKLQYTQIVEIDPVSSIKRVYAYTGAEFLNSVGMAIDPSARIIYSLHTNGDLYSYDMLTKTTSAAINIGFNGVTGLAIDVLGGGTLYTIQTSTNQLIAITATGIATAINTLSSSLIVPTPTLNNPVSLSFDPNTDRIIAAVATVPFATDYLELMAIDKTTAQATSLGGFHARGGADITLAFAYDPVTLINNTLFFYPRKNVVSSILQKINLPAYGGQKITRIPIPFRDLRAIVFDRNSRAIYGLDEKSKYIFKYSAGAITVEAQVKIPGNVSALAMDPARLNTIYAANRSDLFSINTTTWAVTYIGFFGTNIIDMAFDPSGGILYGITSASPSGLVTINTTTGVASTPIIVTGTRSANPIMGIGFSEPAAGTYQLHGISNGRSIYSIDPKSGVATDIDPTKVFTFDISNISFDGTNFIAAFSSTIFSSIKSVDITNLAGTKYVEVEIVEHTYPGGVASLAGYTDVNTNTDTIYVVNAGPLGYLYTVDPISGLSKKLGQFFNMIHSLTVNPSNNQIYGVGGGDIYSIKTSGTQPLDTRVGTPSGVSRFADIAFDASGRLFGIDGATGTTSDFIEFNPVTGTAMAGFRLAYSQGGRFAYKSSTDDFIMASRDAPYNLASVSRTGETRRLSEFRTDEFAYFDSSKTLYRFPDSLSVNINSSKNDLTTTSVMSIGKLFSKAIAHDDASNTLYMINNDTNNLLRIDKNTGQSQVVGYTDLADTVGLLFDPLSPSGKQLFAHSPDAFKFVTIDPKTGRGTVFQTSQSSLTKDFAIDISTDLTGKVISTTVYANTNAGLATVDLATGRVGPVTRFTAGGTAFLGVTGVSIDAAGNMVGLAQLDNSDFYIVDIDKVTGIVTHTLKKTGFETRWVLAMDKNTNSLYSFGQGSGHLVSLDPQTGAGTSRGAPPFNFNQIVYSPSNATTYVQNASTSRILYSIDPSNGNTTFVNGLGKNNIAASGGLAVNPMSLTFYSSDNNFPIRNLSTFDLSTSLSSTPFSFIEETQISVIDLEWNSTTNSLFGLSNNSRRLFQITDLPTATGSFVGTQSLGTANYSSLVYSPATDAFITIENESNLLIIDASSGMATQSILLTGDLPALYAISAQP